jgi:hypothetical protein
MSQLRVRNVRQKILFDEEISGQISDGMWENSRPFDHWKPWCDADVVVAEDGNVGRTFWASRDNYLITSKELLDIVGSRMVGYVRDASTRESVQTKGLPEFPKYDHKQMMEDLRDLRVIMKINTAETTPTPFPSSQDARDAWGRYHTLVKEFEKPLLEMVHAKAREFVMPPVIGADSIKQAFVVDYDAADVEAALMAVAFS